MKGYMTNKTTLMKTTTDNYNYKQSLRKSYWCSLCRANHNCNFRCERNPIRSWKWYRNTQYKSVEVWSHFSIPDMDEVKDGVD